MVDARKSEEIENFWHFGAILPSAIIALRGDTRVECTGKLKNQHIAQVVEW